MLNEALLANISKYLGDDAFMSFISSEINKQNAQVTQFGFTKSPAFILRLPSIVTSFERLINIKFTPRR